jgi:1-acyl-sn-glycerol-3-phosphate acyltransferase
MLRTFVQSAAIWLYLGISMPLLSGVMAVLWLLTAWFDRRRRVCIAFGSLWANHYNWLSPAWGVRSVEGRESFDRRGTYVLVANHQSLGDILMLYALWHHFKWVSKKSLFKVPGLGWAMWLQGHAGLERGHGPSIVKMMKDCKTHLARGSSIAMFPEGTRSLDGRMRPFKRGAFTLAVEAGVAIVPVIIEGTRNLLPKNGFCFASVASRGSRSMCCHR